MGVSESGCIIASIFFLSAALPIQANRGNSDQVSPTVTASSQAPARDSQDYVLGPEDQIKIWALGFEEISEKPIRIDPSGYIDLPMLGRFKAAGLTVEQLKTQLLERLANDVKAPHASVEIIEFGSQPVSVLGAVNQPGVHQLRGRKTLAEIISMAGGLKQDAGFTIKITRDARWGPIPLPNATKDPSGQFSTAEVKVTELLAAKNPGQNILIRPHDVITVPTAETVAVIGAVRKPGTFDLKDRESISVLEALSMAEGLGPTPAPQNAKILRATAGSTQRQEVPIDLRKVLAGKGEDIALRPNDILLVPTSTPKKAGIRAMEAIIQTATGVMIWRGPF